MQHVHTIVYINAMLHHVNNPRFGEDIAPCLVPIICKLDQTKPGSCYIRFPM